LDLDLTAADRMFEVKADAPAHVFNLAKLHVQIIHGKFSCETFRPVAFGYRSHQGQACRCSQFEMGRIDAIAVYDRRNFRRRTQCDRNVADVQFKTCKTVVSCMPVNLAIQRNCLAFPDDAACDADFSAIFNEARLFNIQNLLLIANLECNYAVENAYDLRLLRAQQVKATAHRSKKLT